jgi:hypothetical protein
MDCNAMVSGPLGVAWVTINGVRGVDVFIAALGESHSIARFPERVIPENFEVPCGRKDRSDA